MPVVALYNGGEDGTPVYAIGVATLVGGTWVKAAGNPVLERSPASWDDEHVKDPWALWDGSQFVMYYAGSGDGYPQYQIGRATADSVEGPWTKDASNPVIAQGAGGAFDDAAAGFPVVLYEPADTGREWKMWYGANSGVGTWNSVGYAYSSDGVTWTKHGSVIGLGAGGSWNDTYTYPGGIVKVGATYNLFVSGAQDATVPKWQGGLWTFTDPEGAYTADVGNPVLLSRFNDAGTQQTLTANLMTGNVIAQMGDTSAFNEGEPVVITAWNKQTHVTHIDSIDSGSQVTLRDAVVDDFLTTLPTYMRPFHYISVNPRTVRGSTGAWEMYLSAHQPVEDLTITVGTKLREGSMRATAADLAGPWTYDYGTGLMFPLVPQGTAWDAIAAENPSVLGDGTIEPAAMGMEWGVVAPGPTVAVAADVPLYVGSLGMEWGVVLPGPRVAGVGPRHFMLTGEGIKTPEMTEPIRADGSPAEEGDVPTWHTNRKPTLEAPPAGGTPATTVTDETALGIAPAVGADTAYARQGHTHGSVTAAAIAAAGFVGPILISDTPSTPLVFADLIQNEAQDDLVYADL